MMMRRPSSQCDPFSPFVQRKRAQSRKQAKAAREGVLVEMAGLRRRQAVPVARIAPSQIEAFSRVMRAKLRDKSSTFAKDYLSALVDEVRVVGGTATIAGSNAALLAAVAGKKEGTDKVPFYA